MFIKLIWICKNGGIKKSNDTAQWLTKAKIKRAESANLKCIASNKFYRRLTVNCSEMPASF